MRTRRGFIASVIAAGMVLAACSSGGSTTSSGTSPSSSGSGGSAASSSDTSGSASGSSSSASGSSGSASSGASSAGTVTKGGSITVGIDPGIPQLNPAIRTFAVEETLFPLLWNGLTQTDPDGTVVADLATKWEASDDQKTWTFTLRDGVEFSNGDAFTAKDVVDTFNYYLKPDTATQEANKIKTITDVTAKDDHTVTFTLSDPNALFPDAIVWVKMLDMSTISSIDKNPIGTGPFVVSKFIPSSELTLVRNDKYWGDPAPLDEIKLVAATDSAAAVSSLTAGDLDVLWQIAPSDATQFADGGDVYLVQPKAPSQWPSWEMDTTAAPFDNVKARQALAYATDREQILEASYFGQGIVSPYNNALSTSNPYYSDEGMTDYSYDLDKAKQLFAEAGVKEGDTLTWWSTTSAPEWQTDGQILQASLKKIGINLKIVTNDSSTWAAKFYPAGKSYPGLIVPNRQSTPVSPAFSLNFYLKGRCECNWDDADFEAAYTKAIGEADADASKAAWTKVQQIINEQVPLIVPFQTTVNTAVAKKVSGVWMEGGGQMHLETAGLASS